MIKILGSIASGKTTLARGLSRELGLSFVEERPEENPFLPRMSDAPVRWCFANQAWYLVDAAQSVAQAPRGSGVVADHSAEEVVNIHGPVFAARGWLEKSELELLTSLAAGLECIPTVYVCLSAPPKVLVRRFADRGRPSDRVPEEEYLDAVAEAREQFLRRSIVPVVHLDVCDVDVRLDGDVRNVTKLIESSITRLSGTRS